jgi:hypothetical protein
MSREAPTKGHCAPPAALSRSVPRAGKIRRVTARRALYKLKDYKKVYVRLADDATRVSAPRKEDDGAAAERRSQELR